jgi:hypothetical protein
MAIPALIDTVAQRLTKAKLSAIEDRARRYILWHFVDTGRAPRSSELQRELQLASQEGAAAILARLHAADLLVYDAATASIVAAYPLSSKPTGHRVEVGNRTLHALCAIDALGIPFMLDASALIQSGCLRCQMPVEVDVRDGKISKHRPNGLVVWYPERDICGCAATSRCILVNFFCSAEHLEAWCRANPDKRGTALTLEEAVEAGRIIFGDLLQ